MIYGYCRVSSITQERNGNSLEEQENALKKYGCEEIVTEAFTGKTMDRPLFQGLLNKLQDGDKLVVTKLDRFARTASEGVETVRMLFQRGVSVHILNMGLIENTPTGNLILQVLLSFAEYERAMILERTKAGRAIARQNPNYREGRPKKYTAAQLQHAMELLDGGRTYKSVEAMTGISKSTLIRARKHI